MKIRAVIIEDNDLIRDLLAKILDLRGYDVVSFPNPLACLKKAEEEGPFASGGPWCDILITDLHMPFLTGLEYVRLLSTCEAPMPEAAIMSGGWTEKTLLEAKELGCTVFEKPFSMDDLKEWLTRCEIRIASRPQYHTLRGQARAFLKRAEMRM
jgi:DNA-binding response OmpR family regulator